MLPATRKKSTTTITTRMADQVLACSLFPDNIDQSEDNADQIESDKKKDPLSSQVWRMYTKAKDNLPNGSRLENLTWRMMAMTLKKENDTTTATVAPTEPMDSDPELKNATISKSSPMVINKNTTSSINIPANYVDNVSNHDTSSFVYGSTHSADSPTSTPTFFFGNDPPNHMGSVSFEDMLGMYYNPTLIVDQQPQSMLPPTPSIDISPKSSFNHYYQPSHSPSPSISSVEEESPSSSITPTPSSSSNRAPQTGFTQCSNCSTKTTPLWRRDPAGNALCNACGLFLKLHGVVRPLSLKTDVIKKRNRNTSQAKKEQQQQQQQQQQPLLSTSLPSREPAVSVRPSQSIKRQRRDDTQQETLSSSMPLLDPTIANYFGSSLPTTMTPMTEQNSSSNVYFNPLSMTNSSPPGLVHSSSNSSLASLTQLPQQNQQQQSNVYSLLENIGVQLNNLPPELLPLIASAANYQAMTATQKPSSPENQQYDFLNHQQSGAFF